MLTNLQIWGDGRRGERRWVGVGGRRGGKREGGWGWEEGEEGREEVDGGGRRVSECTLASCIPTEELVDTMQME